MSRAVIATTLTAIAEQLQHANMWQSSPPSLEALASTEPFCCDTMAFEQWLQWVLLVRLQLLLEVNAPLPTNCAIAAMAEYAWQGKRECEPIIALLHQLDQQLTGAKA